MPTLREAEAVAAPAIVVAPPGFAPWVLAHAGPGATWQAMAVAAGLTLAGFAVAAAIGRRPLGRADDLVVPFATAAVLASLAPFTDDVLSDAIGWTLPLGVVALATLLLGAFTRLDVRVPARLPVVALVVALVATAVLGYPLTVALHPDGELVSPDGSP